MAKKIILAVFSGIAVFGLVLALVGFLIGGRFGTMFVEDNQLVYSENGQQLSLATVPHWVGGVGGVGGVGRYYTSVPTPIPPLAPSPPEKPAPFGATDLERIDVDVDAGYVIIQPGNEFGLTVDGPLPYDLDYSNGTWTLDVSGDNVQPRGSNQQTRFWRNGKDVTTTFILTVPPAFSELCVDINLGGATIESLSVNYLECSTELGNITLNDVSATESIFDVELGSIQIDNFQGQNSTLDCGLGSIKIQGDITELFTAKCEAGSIKGTLTRPSTYGWTAQTELGSIKLDSHTIAGFDSTSNGNTDATPFFDLQCELGSINIQFTN